MKSLLSLNKYLWNYKWRLFMGSLFIIMANLFELFKYIYFGKSIDLFKKSIEESIKTEKQELDALGGLFLYGAIGIGLALLSGLFRFAMRQTIIVTSRLIEFDLKNHIFEHYQKLSLGFYKRNKIGDLMNRISEDVAHVRMYLGPGIMNTINLVSLFVIFIGYMFYTNFSLALYALAPLPILSVLIYKISAVINTKSKMVQQEQSAISAYVQDIFSGIRVVKSYNRENIATEDYEKKTTLYREKSLSLGLVNAFFFPLMVLLIGLSYIFILYKGGTQYMDGKVTMGVMAEFFMLVGALAWPFTVLGWVTSIVQRAEASQQRINEFLNEQPEIVNTQPKRLEEIKGKIAYKDVSFMYPNTGIQALKNISFEVNPGETLAIVGRTGSGKTTIVQLLARLFDPDKGLIEIDDIPIKDINLSQLRESIGFVPQETFLFSDSIANNINFGIDGKDISLVRDAAKNAAIDDNIERFQEKYDTLIGERGVTLSGGQKQRIALARAMIKNPEILVFDDSLSAIDTETEERILNNLTKETKNKTTIIISHRLSSAVKADKIIYLKNGEIAEMGTHQELMALERLYFHLYNMQLSEKELKS